MTHYSYLVALFGSIFIFFIECFLRKGEVPYPLLSLDGLYKAEEIINVIALNSVNELFSFIMMLYLARRTHIVRASVFGVIPQLYVIIEGFFAKRVGPEQINALILEFAKFQLIESWFVFVQPWWEYVEIVCFLTGYVVIWLERVVKTRNQAAERQKMYKVSMKIVNSTFAKRPMSIQ